VILKSVHGLIIGRNLVGHRALTRSQKNGVDIFCSAQTVSHYFYEKDKKLIYKGNF
jgi:hypothetical protein